MTNCYNVLLASLSLCASPILSLYLISSLSSLLSLFFLSDLAFPPSCLLPFILSLPNRILFANKNRIDENTFIMSSALKRPARPTERIRKCNIGGQTLLFFESARRTSDISCIRLHVTQKNIKFGKKLKKANRIHIAFIMHRVGGALSVRSASVRVHSSCWTLHGYEPGRKQTCYALRHARSAVCNASDRCFSRARRIVLIRHGESEGNIDEAAYVNTADW